MIFVWSGNISWYVAIARNALTSLAGLYAKCAKQSAAFGFDALERIVYDFLANTAVEVGVELVDRRKNKS